MPMPVYRRLRSAAAIIFAVGALALLGSGCAVVDGVRHRLGGGQTAPIIEQPSVPPVLASVPGLPVRAVSVLTLQLTGLRPLASGHYEGWAIFDHERVSTGKFATTQDGQLVALNGAAIAVFPLARDIADAREIAVTIEPEGDRDGIPSGIVILTGALTGGRARLDFPVALNALGGGFVLASPTDADPGDESAGVWFTDTTRTQPALALPELPAGWVFEGWAGTQGLSFSMGRFVRATGADFAAPFSGPRLSPRFPGEDFVARLPAAVRGPVNLADGASTIAIAVEPDLGGQDPTGLGPFWLLPLRREVPADTPSGVPQTLDLDLSVVPAGVATIG